MRIFLDIICGIKGFKQFKLSKLILFIKNVSVNLLFVLKNQYISLV